MQIYALCPYCLQEVYSEDGLMAHLHNHHGDLKIRNIEHLNQRLENIGYTLSHFLRVEVDETSEIR